MENWNGNFRYQFDAIINQQEVRVEDGFLFMRLEFLPCMQLVEYYTPPFKTCARDSNVGAFMCTYSALNGVPTCADPWLLQDVLRDHWNWTSEQQWVTSDCDSIQNVFYPHGYAATREEAAALSLKAGTDLDCGTLLDCT